MRINRFDLTNIIYKMYMYIYRLGFPAITKVIDLYSHPWMTNKAIPCSRSAGVHLEAAGFKKHPSTSVPFHLMQRWKQLHTSAASIYRAKLNRNFFISVCLCFVRCLRVFSPRCLVCHQQQGESFLLGKPCWTLQYWGQIPLVHALNSLLHYFPLHVEVNESGRESPWYSKNLFTSANLTPEK